MLSRLCVGLIDEGATISRVVPQGIDDDLAGGRSGLVLGIEYDPKVVFWMRGQQRDEIVRQFEGRIPDLFYASGRRCWSLARALGEAIERPVVLDIWSSDDVRQLRRVRGPRSNEAYCAATNALAGELQKRIPAELIATVPAGVSVPDAPTPIFVKPEDSLGIAVLGRARSLPAYRAVIGALRQLADSFPSLQIFIELSGQREHEIWRLTRQYDLLDRTSMLTAAHQHRALLTRCDLVILPEAAGEVRTSILEIMAAGVPVAAREDPILDYLIADRTAALVPTTSVEAWTAVLRRILGNPEEARALASRARSWITDHHRSSRQAALLYAMLERVVTGGAYPFSSGQK